MVVFVTCRILRYISFTQRRMSTVSDGNNLLEMVRSVIPQLSQHLHKGQCGRIGVIGGCQQYTGAPYFAAISALKVGADLSYVFCTRDAAPVIKSYSPELIVYPVLDDSSAIAKISEILPKLHCIVIGPGLGRDDSLLQVVKGVIKEVRSLQLPVVIDADGVFLVCSEPSLITGYTKAILTPNAVEFAHLLTSVTRTKDSNKVSDVEELSRAMGNVTIVKKGQEDVITDGRHTLVCSAAGSSRRCGGQGDLLSGSMSTFSYWANSSKSSNSEFVQYGPTLTAAYAACLLTRHCAVKAFERNRRSTTTTDLIATISDVFNEHFEH